MPPTLVKGCCPLDCQDSCAWVAHVDDGKVTRVQGAPDHPFTRGALCAKTHDYERRAYAPDRLLHPLRRTGPKGSGQFERISWDEAADLIAARFAATIRAHGAEAIMPLNYLGSMGVVQRRALMRLFHAIGATRFHGSVCGAAGNALEAEGHPRGFDPESIAESRLVVLWGANVLTTSHHHWHFIQEAKRRHGAKIVSIDPRRTRTAAASDEHLSIRPGSDTALAAGIARVMLEEGLADEPFAREATADLDAFVAEVRAWTPERVADACGIAPEDVVRLGRMLGAARPATLRCGVGPQQSVHGEDLVRALSALAILGGHWRRPGGGLFIETSPAMDESRAARPDLGPRGVRSLDLAKLGQHLLDERLDPPIKALMVWGMNPLVSQPDAGAVRAGLAREDLFTVVIEHFMTDTARYADVVLPSTTQLEHFDVQGAWGHHYVHVNNPAIPPLGESKSHGDILRLLATRMGLDEPALHETDDQIAAATLPPDVTLDELKARGWHKSAPPAPNLAGAGLRIAFAVRGPPTPPAPGMLQLLTPKAHQFMNSSFANMPRQRRAMVRPTLEMHEDDARALRLAHDAPVVIRNERGAVRAWLHVSRDLHRGTVALPGKWWGAPDEAAALANLLSPAAYAPHGQPAYNETFVTVTRAE